VACQLACARVNFVDGGRGIGGAGRCSQRRAVISQRGKRHRRLSAGHKGQKGAVGELGATSSCTKRQDMAAGRHELRLWQSPSNWLELMAGNAFLCGAHLVDRGCKDVPAGARTPGHFPRPRTDHPRCR
jgi:hypothetical protein